MSRFRRGQGRPQSPRGGRFQPRNAGTIRFTQRIHVDAGKALALMSTLAVGFVKKRTSSGRDVAGNPFAAYRPSYASALRKGGESTKVDLTLTGGLINSIAELGRAVTADGGEVRIGPGTGTSPRVSLANGVARRTGGRGPAHNIVGAYIHFGTPKMAARKFLGLTLKERQKISKALTRQSARVLKEKRGG